MTLARPLLAAVLAFGALAVSAPLAGATSNLNNLNCKGHIEAGKPEPGDDDTQVAYKFACDGPITGYQLQPQTGDTGFDTSTIVLDQQGVPVTTDSFTCQGDFPGFGINCTGVYHGPWTVVQGQFTIAGKLCDEPRVDPLLTVVTATADTKGVITQSISGPYDLGRPHGCKSAGSAKPKTKASKKAAAKRKAASKA